MPLIMEPNPPPPPQNLSPPTPPSPTLHPTHLAIPLPFSPHTTLHLQITRLETSNLIFLTSTDPSTSGSLSSLGSFVYAMPNRYQPSDPLCTPLYSLPGSIDFATRVAKILARRTGKPVYVGCSIVLGNPTVEEEVAYVRAAVGEAMKVLGDGEKG
ncbi:MAG: hypothetical protein LQ338_005097 [Usnochroma carphineum]|nr:MAG: hypothetical protein LQ338_005097 [Usnochroma carphineum]